MYTSIKVTLECPIIANSLLFSVPPPSQVYINKQESNSDTARSHGDNMDIMPQTCLHGDVPRIPPLRNVSTLTVSFTGALPRKTNTFSLWGLLFSCE